MNLERIFSESIQFTRAALVDAWQRWLIYVLLGLPWLIVNYLVDARSLIDGTAIRWELVPWGKVALLVPVAVVLSFFISGYIVRILRGGDTPPEFNNWLQLAADGIRLDIVALLWSLPILSIILLSLYLMTGGPLTGGSLGFTLGLLLLMPVAMIAELAVVIITLVYGITGAIRFARTGSVREAFAISAIRSTVRRIGRVNFVVALGVLLVVSILYFVVTGFLLIIPYAGPVLVACIGPLLEVFRFRFLAMVYDAQDTVPGTDAPAPIPGGTAGAPPSPGAPGREIVMWALVLAGLLAAVLVPVYLLISAGGFFFPPLTMAELKQAQKDDISVYSPEGYFGGPLFTHDGNSIMYLATTRPEVKPQNREFGSSDWENDIWIMDREGNNQTRVTRVGDIQRFFLDPVSDTIAYSRYEKGNTSVFLIRDRESPPARVPGPLPYLYFSSWSPDGRRFAATGFNLSDYNGWSIMTDGRAPATGTEWSRLFILNADGSSPREIARVSTGEWDLMTESSWSPDGERLVVPLFLPVGSGLGVVDTGTGSTVSITHAKAWYPHWSPAGDRIAFIRQGDVYTVNPDGSGERRLAGDGTVEALAWNPNGSRLAFSADSYLGIIDADGSNLNRISNIQPGPLSWSPDGNTLVYAPGMGVRIRIMSLTPGVMKMGEYMSKQMDKFMAAWTSPAQQ
jgi:hypothetical protein